MTPESRSSMLHDLWVQLPFLAWLTVLWMLLWGQFTLLALLTGLVVAVFVTRVFRLPTIDLVSRLNLWYMFLFMARFLWSVVLGALSVTVQVWDFRRQPGAAIVGVPLRYADDLVTTHVSVTASLIPGSFVVETDRFRRILYLHVIGVRDGEDIARFRTDLLEWEKRIVRAIGTPAQYRALKADERAERDARAGRVAT